MMDRTTKFVRIPLDGDTRDFHTASVGLSLGF
jgi:hypothetical protein